MRLWLDLPSRARQDADAITAANRSQVPIPERCPHALVVRLATYGTARQSRSKVLHYKSDYGKNTATVREQRELELQVIQGRVIQQVRERVREREQRTKRLYNTRWSGENGAD